MYYSLSAVLKAVNKPSSAGKLAALVALFTYSGLLLIACQNEVPPTYQGYAEGEFVMIAAPYAGNLETLAVERGQQVEANRLLFALEHANEQAAKRGAEERLKSAEAKLANLQASKRPSEIATIRAEVAQAAAAHELSTLQLRKQEKLFAAGFTSKEQLDEARANYERDSARLAEADAQLRTAHLSIGREAEIQAARAEVEAARAALLQNEWQLAQKTANAPADALVQDTFYVEGEWVPAGSPIVSLLPPANIKVRFFVPEAVVGSLQTGQPVSITCDGCGPAIQAVISYIAPQSEYTPPVIYSKEARAKLVFLVEARPSAQEATRLHPGQPVDVAL
jgi:HlyD family secretion protein